MYINRLRKLRKQYGLTLEQMSNITGISIGYLSHLELGTRNNPSMEIMEKISFALGKDLVEVFFSDK